MKNKKIGFVLIFLLVNAFFPNSSFAVQKKKWTLLFFQSANNDLWVHSPVFTSHPGVNIVAQIGHQSEVTREVLPEDSTFKNLQVVEQLGSLDMGSAQVFLDFLKWGITKYPAEHYLVMISNHGSGWNFRRNPTQGLLPEAISGDTPHKSAIDVDQLGWALKEASKLIGRPIDFYFSYACQMQQLEVASEMIGAVNYVGGSPTDITGSGIGPEMEVVSSFITQLQDDSPAVMARKSVSHLKKWWGFSVIDMKVLPQFLSAIRGFTREIHGQIPLLSNGQFKALIDPANYHYDRVRRESNSYVNTENFDAISLFKNIHSLLRVTDQKELRLIEETHKNLVVSQSPDGQFSSGLAISFLFTEPGEGNYFCTAKDLVIPQYKTLAFSKMTEWGELMNVIASRKCVENGGIDIP